MRKVWIIYAIEQRYEDHVIPVAVFLHESDAKAALKNLTDAESRLINTYVTKEDGSSYVTKEGVSKFLEQFKEFDPDGRYSSQNSRLRYFHINTIMLKE